MSKTLPVSVIMSVYNGERYLAHAVQSILAQTFPDFEFIIIDDGSTDDTAKILDEYDDSRINRVTNPKNIGLASSLNRGLGLARGRYIARMDTDDISLPERLARQVDFLETHPEVGVLGAAVQMIDDQGNSLYQVHYPTTPHHIRWRLWFSCPLAHPAVMMRQQVIEQVGGYQADLKRTQDYELWTRLISITSFANLPEVLVLYRQHETSVSARYSREPDKFSSGKAVIWHSRVVSHILGEEVSQDWVKRCLFDKPESSEHVGQIAELFYRLWRAINENYHLSPLEKRLIRREAAYRLYILARPRLLWGGRVWRVFGLGLWLDPLLPGRVIGERLCRAIKIDNIPKRSDQKG